jgi:hypothetical protein
MVAKGMSKDDIALALNTTPGSVAVNCSKYKVSLRRDRKFHKKSGKRPFSVLPKASLFEPPPRPLPQRKPRRLTLNSALVLSRVAQSRLRQHADAVGMTEAELASRLLEVIALDNLYDAVLDRPQPQQVAA